MDSFEWNKVAGAVLFALLLSVGVSIFSDTLFESEAPETPGFIVAVATQEGGATAAAAPQPIGTLLAAADAHAGETDAKKCGACHTFDAGGPNKVGPNLYGVVNRPIASHEGFEYDDAMKAFAATAKDWTFEHLNTFLTDPKKTVPGTKMAFPGLKDDKERANVIAYLRTLSDNPAPLPAAASAEAAPATEVASAESTTTATDAAPAAPASPAAEAPTAAAPATEAPAAAEAPAATAPATEAPATAEAPAPPAESAPTPAEPAAQATAEPPPATPEPAPAPAAPAEQQVAQAEAPAAEAPAAAAPPAAAGAGDPAKGATFAKRCAACHSFADGGPNQVGPHLFGVVGRPVASVADFGYSDAMKAFSDGGKKVWDDATLDTYLANPKGVVPGTKMAFPGVKKDTDRANVIAYLNSLKP